VSEEMKKKIFDTDAKKEFYIDANNGGSSIISPRGTYLAEPVLNKEMIVYTDIDLEMIIDAKWASDCTGHYARPDLTRLLINEEKCLTYETRKSAFDFTRGKNQQEFEDDLKKLTDQVEKSGNKTLQNHFSNFISKYTLNFSSEEV